MRLESNSGGTDEQGYIRPLGEVWSPEARIASAISRAARSGPTPYRGRASKTAPWQKPEDGKKSGGRAAATAAKKAAKKGERTNDRGERVLDYDDGGSVTVHKDGTATFRNKAGAERKGTYKDPQAKREPAPEGFRDAAEPRPKAAKRVKRVAAKRVSPAVMARANASATPRRFSRLGMQG